MGYYIEVPKNKNKAAQLVELYEAQIIPKPKKFSDVPEDKALICVVENTAFDAAGFCYNEREFKVFERDFSNPQRPRTWLLMDKVLTKKLSGFNLKGE
jgi:hypothetical protein